MGTCKGILELSATTNRYEGLTLDGAHLVSVGRSELEATRDRIDENGGLKKPLGVWTCFGADIWRSNLEKWVNLAQDRPRPDIIVTEVSTSAPGAPHAVS